MSVAAIICEYNPLHLGHKYQIETIKRMLGQDTVIVCIMSGSIVQRGEVAVCDKYSRAAAAVTVGADLVLELPYPFSGSVAEQFALGAVSILNSLGFVDYLVFGSENGDIASLCEHVDRRFCKEFEEYLAVKRQEYKNLSFPQLVSLCYKERYGLSFPDGPNDILGIYYLKALKQLHSSIRPLTHLRLAGSSATLARAELKKEIKALIPKEVQGFFNAQPATLERGERAMLSSLRTINDPLLSSHAMQSDSLACLYERLADKNSTRANLRRKILAAMLGYDEKYYQAPVFSNVLAMSASGARLLRQHKKTIATTLVTKPSDYRNNPEIVAAYEMNLRADNLFSLCTPNLLAGSWSLRATPFVKK